MPSKADKTLRILTETVGGVPRIRRVSKLADIERGAIFEVIGESGKYRCGVYRDADGDLVRECSCRSGELYPRSPRCSHMAAVRIVMAAIGVPK